MPEYNYFSMSDSHPRRFPFIAWGNLLVGVLWLLGILFHTANLMTSRMPSYIYGSTLYVRIPLEVTLGVLTLRGAWKLIQGRGERLLMIASSASLGYSLVGLWIAWGNADPSHLQIGNVRDILRSQPMSEWRNLIVVDTLHALASNTLMLVWSSISLRSTLFAGHLPTVVPKIKESAKWLPVLIAFGVAAVCRFFLFGVEIQAGFYSTR